MLERDRAAFAHLGGMNGLYSDLQVESARLELALLARFQEHRGENRHGAFLLDDPLGAVESASEFVGPDLQLHLGCLS